MWTYLTGEIVFLSYNPAISGDQKRIFLFENNGARSRRFIDIFATSRCDSNVFPIGQLKYFILRVSRRLFMRSMMYSGCTAATAERFVAVRMDVWIPSRQPA